MARHVKFDKKKNQWNVLQGVLGGILLALSLFYLFAYWENFYDDLSVTIQIIRMIVFGLLGSLLVYVSLSNFGLKNYKVVVRDGALVVRANSLFRRSEKVFNFHEIKNIEVVPYTYEGEEDLWTRELLVHSGKMVVRTKDKKKYEIIEGYSLKYLNLRLKKILKGIEERSDFEVESIFYKIVDYDFDYNPPTHFSIPKGKTLSRAGWEALGAGVLLVVFGLLCWNMDLLSDKGINGRMIYGQALATAFWLMAGGLFTYARRLANLGELATDLSISRDRIDFLVSGKGSEFSQAHFKKEDLACAILDYRQIAKDSTPQFELVLFDSALNPTSWLKNQSPELIEQICFSINYWLDEDLAEL